MLRKMPVTTLLDLIMKEEMKGRHLEIAEYISQHPDEYSEVLNKAFNAENTIIEMKTRLLEIVDFLSSNQALTLIQTAINDEDSRIRARAVKAAYRTRVESLNEQIISLVTDQTEEFEIRKWGIHILASSDPDAYAKVVRRIARDQSEHTDIRREAIFALTNMDDDITLGVLCILLGDQDPEIRKSGAWALGKIRSSSVINCLLAAIDDNDDGVSDWAIRGLRDMDDARALQGLTDVMKSSEPQEQVRLIRLLIERRSDILLRAIAESLSSPNVHVRREAAWAMGVALFTPAIPSLETLLDDEDEQVRDYAKTALMRMGQFDPSAFDLKL
jgi:HEAT repeat protein